MKDVRYEHRVLKVSKEGTFKVCRFDGDCLCETGGCNRCNKPIIAELKRLVG